MGEEGRQLAPNFALSFQSSGLFLDRHHCRPVQGVRQPEGATSIGAVVEVAGADLNGHGLNVWLGVFGDGPLYIAKITGAAGAQPARKPRLLLEPGNRRQTVVMFRSIWVEFTA